MIKTTNKFLYNSIFYLNLGFIRKNLLFKFLLKFQPKFLTKTFYN